MTAKQLVRNLTAPVFGRTGAVVITLTLDGFRGPLPMREIRRLGDTLLGSTRRVTQGIQGRFPDDYPASASAAS